MLWGSLVLCKKDEREEGVPGQGLSRKSGEPEAGCGMLIRFRGLKVPRDYKFLSCKKQSGQLLLSVIKMDNTHADQNREQFLLLY